MSLWTMIFLIVLLSFAYAFWHRKTELNSGIARDNKGNIVKLDGGREEELERELTALRERINVLERIATDANSSDTRKAEQIAAEIDRLRDS